MRQSEHMTTVKRNHEIALKLIKIMFVYSKKRKKINIILVE